MAKTEWGEEDKGCSCRCHKLEPKPDFCRVCQHYYPPMDKPVYTIYDEKTVAELKEMHIIPTAAAQEENDG